MFYLPYTHCGFSNEFDIQAKYGNCMDSSMFYTPKTRQEVATAFSMAYKVAVVTLIFACIIIQVLVYLVSQTFPYSRDIFIHLVLRVWNNTNH